MSTHNQSEESQKPWGKIFSIVGVLIGFGILAGAILSTNFTKFTQTFINGGFPLLLLTLFYPVELLSRGYGWKFIYPYSKKIPTRFFMMGMWYAQSINRLLPTATIGGVIVRGRYLDKKGADESAVLASLVADKTVHGITTVVILLLGLILVLTEQTGQEIIIIILCICLVLSIGIYFFIRLQLSDTISEKLEKWSDKFTFLKNITDTVGKADEQLDCIYENPRGLIASVVVRVLGDIALTAEVWVAALIMHSPISVRDAFTLRLVGFGIRSAAFFIWGGMGVQESIYALLSSFIGLSPAELIAISLATRLPEFFSAVPGVALWLGKESYKPVDDSESKVIEENESEDTDDVHPSAGSG
jgi:putative membrane protein